MRPLADLDRIVPLVLDQQQGLGLRGDQDVEADFAFAGEAHVAAVHQVARRRLRRQDVADGAGGVVEALEQQQDDAAMPRQG